MEARGVSRMKDLAYVSKAPAQRVVPGEFWCAYTTNPVSFTPAVPHAPVSAQRCARDRCVQNPGRGGARRLSNAINLPSKRYARNPMQAISPRHVACLALIIPAVFFALHAGTFVLHAPTVDTAMPTEIVAVAQGDTLWSIAASHPIEGMSTQQCVRWISIVNELDGSVLIPGQAIEVPGGSVQR